MTLRLMIALAAVLTLASGCGIQGSLYLPEEEPKPRERKQQPPAAFPDRPDRGDDGMPQLMM